MWSQAQIQQGVVEVVDCIARQDLSSLQAKCASMPRDSLQRVLHSRHKSGSPIEHAGLHDNYDILTYLADIDESLNEAFMWGVWSYYFGKNPLKALRVLVERGLDINGLDMRGKSLLGYVTSSLSDFDQMRYLLELGTDINHVDEMNHTALWTVLSNPHFPLLLERVSLVLDHGCELHQSAIIQAIPRRNLTLLHILMDRGISADEVDGDAWLHATLHGSMELLKYLQARNVSIEFPELKEQALFIAVIKCYLPMVKFWVEQGAQVSQKVYNMPQSLVNFFPLGSSAVFGAMFAKDEDILQYLLNQESFDVGEVDMKSKTLLMSACEQYHLSFVPTLLERGVQVNAIDQVGKTAAMYLVQSQNATSSDEQISTLQDLLQSGADFNVADKKGKTLAHYGAQSGNLNILKYLSTLPGIELSARDIMGNTWLHDLVEYGPSTLQAKYDPREEGCLVRLQYEIIECIDFSVMLDKSLLHQVNVLNQTPLDVCDAIHFPSVASYLKDQMLKTAT